LAAAASLLFAAYSGQAATGNTIGLLVFSEDARFVRAAKGIKDTLEGAGMSGPRTRVIEENAEGDKTKAAALAEKFALARMDLVFAVGTQATVAAARRIKDVPLVFAEVYDPVEARIAKAWKSSGNNTTGTPSKGHMPKLIECLRRFAPVRSLAVLYTPGEANSELVLRDLRLVEAELALRVVPVQFAEKGDAVRFLSPALRSVDALYVTGSSVIDRELSSVVVAVTKAKKVSTSHLPDMVERGVLLGLCTNPYLIGRSAGEKALRILQGAKPSSIPLDSPAVMNIILNLRTARAGGFTISPDFMKTVSRTIE